MGTARNPLVYEIHTAAFLRQLSKQSGQPVTLGSVPSSKWDALQELGVQIVWLMGVWQRSPAGAPLSMTDPAFLPDLQKDIPGLTLENVIGSAYCIRGYEVNEQFGGAVGLAEARAQLADRGMQLMLDFVPNHTAPDHPWTLEHPDYYIGGTEDELAQDPSSYLQVGDHIFARGRDPNYAAWPDVVQLNAFSSGYRQATIDTLRAIADQSDAVRCDMAMLMSTTIFADGWGERAGVKPNTEFWTEVTQEVRKTHPDFMFLAESYWDTERMLTDQGFDYCYDKTFYDKLLYRPASEIRAYIHDHRDDLSKRCLFIENHDEPRAASLYDPSKNLAAATAVMTLPGMRLLHDGQLEAKHIKIPVHVNTGPDEAIQTELQASYQKLLQSVSMWPREGEWHLYNLTNDAVIAWVWVHEQTTRYVFINYSDQPTECNAYIPAAEYVDVLTGETIHAPEQANDSYVVPLAFKPWQSHLLSVTRAA